MKLLALVSVRNDLRYLPGYVGNVAPHVDGIVALDDGSTDGSAEFLAEREEVVQLLRVPAGRPKWDEVGNHRALVAAALRHRTDWIVCLDADERVEKHFRARAERVIEQGRALGLEAYALRMHELWDSASHYRADGIWGRKTVARLFRARSDHDFDTRPMHAHKAPLQGMVEGRFPEADIALYHLRMIHAADRVARRRRYEQADPESRWQPGLGYAYLTDERGVRLRPVPEQRGYLE